MVVTRCQRRGWFPRIRPGRTRPCGVAGLAFRYASAVTLPPPGAVECLKSAGLRSVWLMKRAGRAPRVLKAWPLDPLLAIKLLLGISQPQRQRRGAVRTSEARVLTPKVLRGPRLTRRGLLPVVELELAYVPGEPALELLRRDALSGSQQGRLGRACGEIVGLYAAAGLFHRDLKLSNLIVDLDRTTVWVVDTVGVRRMRRPASEVARMLERMWVEAGELQIKVAPALQAAVLRAALMQLPRPMRHWVLGELRAMLPR